MIPVAFKSTRIPTSIFEFEAGGVSKIPLWQGICWSIPSCYPSSQQHIFDMHVGKLIFQGDKISRPAIPQSFVKLISAQTSDSTSVESIINHML